MRASTVATGAGAALALALPAALLAQVIDALAGEDDTPPLVFALVPVILAGAALGGWVVGARRGGAAEGAGAGFLAIAVVQGLGVARRLVAGETVTWAAVPVFLVLGAALGAGGASLAGRRASDGARR